MGDHHDAPDADRPSLCPAPSELASPRPRRVANDPKRGARQREVTRELVWRRIDLDAAVADDDPVGSIRALVEGLELSALYAPIEARDEVVGVPAIDPKILRVLWIYATRDGEGSPREVGRLTELHAAYRWLRGGVAVGYQR